MHAYTTGFDSATALAHSTVLLVVSFDDVCNVTVDSSRRLCLEGRRAIDEEEEVADRKLES